MIKIIKSLFLTNRLFAALAGIAVLFVISFFWLWLIFVPKILFWLLLALALTDLLLLYRVKTGLQAERKVADKLSNGDENEILIPIKNFYSYPVSLKIYDEAPHQFQRRDIEFQLEMKPGEENTIQYFLRPVKRGEYSFGSVNILASTPLKLLRRRFKFSSDKMVPVYPSYLQMRKYELIAIHHRLTETGVKKIRRIGHNQEFELIKEYVQGDDFRTVNWKATARKSRLMVNQFQDERSQQVYSLIDKSRVMQMPFKGMSLLDYAINTCLTISNIAIKKYDKAGLITFQDKVNSILPAGRLNNQMNAIQEALYRQKTAYLESDFSNLYATVRKNITHRSLLLLFTNFESIYGLQRQLPYLINMNRQHLLVVIFFENTEIKSVLEKKTSDLKEIYLQAVAGQFDYEKKLIIKELGKYGIHSILTAPENLTVNTINKYLELKARNLI
jgi:uncharacterized protein (DUF58 family)